MKLSAKVLSALMALAMSVLCVFQLVSCGNGTEQPGDTTPAVTLPSNDPAESTDPPETEPVFKEANYGGADFTVFMRSETASSYAGIYIITEEPSEMVLGYVSVTAPATTRYFIRSYAIQFHKTRRSDFDFEPVYVQRSDWRLYYRRNYDVYMLHTEEGAGTGRDTEEDYEFDWLPARCIKCWIWGNGTKQKPEWWPNDHQ